MPGSGSFQAMFLVSLHCTGSRVSLLTPLWSGPRQLGQLSAQTPAAPHTMAQQARSNAFDKDSTDSWQFSFKG